MLSALLELDDTETAVTNFASLRMREFARLDANGHAYLDYTGSALYPESLISAHARMLKWGVFGNPHAENPASSASTSLIENARHRVLAFFDADPAEYAVCFTANATAALALVGSAYRFSVDAPLLLSADNHNSVNGIREYARRRGAAVHVLPLDNDLRLDSPEVRLRELANQTASRRPRGGVLATTGAGDSGLFAFPAQSNFSGAKHPLSLVEHAQSLGFRVLLDAAAYVPMSRLSLRETPADFVAVSFYKMFGYPTGVGALIARRDALAALERPWFSGGTVDFVSVQNDMHALRNNEEAFEDGTANFLAIGAVANGLDHLDAIGLHEIDHHACALATELSDALRAATHANGAPLAELYGPQDAADRGATIAFNVLDVAGKVVPYALVEKRARSVRVSIRGGCFCNPGASEAAFRFPAEKARECLIQTRDDAWSIEKLGDCMTGFPVGALRASFGAPSSTSDLRRLLAIVRSFASSA